MSVSLERAAARAGIQPGFRDYFGNETLVSDDTKRELLAAMGIGLEDEEAEAALPPSVVVRQGEVHDVLAGLDRPEVGLENGATVRSDLDRLPLGYHRLRGRRDGASAECHYIVVPRHCYLGERLERGRCWALATQLYALRSRGDWGIGDFGDLARLARIAGEAGAAAIGLNPLHELQPSNPLASSPYAPSSRVFLNGQYVDVAAVPELENAPAARALLHDPAFVAERDAARAAPLVDYGAVASLKRRALELLYASFRIALSRTGDARASAFRRFVRDGGGDLERLAVYEALAEHFRERDPGCYGWLQWPPAYRDPASPQVARFRRERADRVDFYLYVQFLAREQLGAAARAAARHGVGLYRDLAVGVDLNGADAWSDQRTIVAGAALGAPPDALNAHGQNWGLPPLSPHALRESGYVPFARLLRANMHDAAILRIDHAMALQRAFWIPRGRTPAEGAYVSYPIADMFGIVALESVRARCAVVGEDLGTVPEGFDAWMSSTRVLSSRLVYFERDFHTGTFRGPQSYPRLAAASIGTHDLPPLAGWWIADDLAVRARIGLLRDDAARANAYEERRHARYVLVDALQHYGAADAQLAERLREDAGRGGTLAVTGELSLAVHRFLALTPSCLAVVAIEDVLGETDAVNVPGTVGEHPNWRRKRSQTLEDLERTGLLKEIGAIFHAVEP